MKLNVTPAEMAALHEQERICEIAPGVYDEERLTRWLKEQFGIRPQFPPVEYQIAVRHDVLAIPCVGVERLEP